MPLAPSPDFTKDYARSQVGAVLTPLSTSSTNSLLQDADPALYYALDFWASMIRLYEGPRFVQAAIAAGLVNPDGTPIQDPVAQSYPWAPDDEQLSTQFKFPLLAAYRKDGKSRWLSASYYDDNCAIDVVYVLPPMTAAQKEQILPILNAVKNTLTRSTTQGFDPNYTPPGGALGQQPWVLTLAGVEEIGLDKGHHYGSWPGTGNLKFPFLHLEGFIVERDNWVPATRKISGVDTEVDLFGPDGTIVPNLINTSTQEAPIITGLSPAVGPIAGGTSVTVSGTLFLPGPTVYLGTQRVYNVTYGGAGQLTIVTPAYLNAGQVTLTVINRDGQSAVSPPFTYQ